MQRYQATAGWGFLAIVGIILIIVGVRGRPGSLLAVVTAPDQMLTPDTPRASGVPQGEIPGPTE